MKVNFTELKRLVSAQAGRLWRGDCCLLFYSRCMLTPLGQSFTSDLKRRDQRAVAFVYQTVDVCVDQYVWRVILYTLLLQYSQTLFYL